MAALAWTPSHYGQMGCELAYEETYENPIGEARLQVVSYLLYSQNEMYLYCMYYVCF